jgi:hypothetical protein
MVQKEDGRVDWYRVITVMIAPFVGWLLVTVYDLSREVAAIRASREATIAAYDKRIRALEDGTASATSERYRRSDADREHAISNSEIEKLRDRVEKHERDDLLKFKVMGR